MGLEDLCCRNQAGSWLRPTRFKGSSLPTAQAGVEFFQMDGLESGVWEKCFAAPPGGLEGGAEAGEGLPLRLISMARGLAAERSRLRSILPAETPDTAEDTAASFSDDGAHLPHFPSASSGIPH